jgi:hypothetical protein
MWIGLAMAGLFPIGIVVCVFVAPELLPTEKASIIAGALAVLTSVISAGAAISVVKLTEDQLKPYPYHFIDARSRTGLIQLSVTNFGGSTAHDVRLQWKQPLLKSNGNKVSLGPRDYIPVLLPKETMRFLVDGAIEFYAKSKEHNYSGQVEFRNSSGRRFRHPFSVSAEQFRGSLIHDDEMSQTHGKAASTTKNLGRSHSGG